jgi:biopolymer transport protein TolR
MARSRSPEGINEPNMTPLIDVSLVLVVILLVATPMAFQSGIAVSRASQSARASAAPVKSERIEISILADDRIEVNGRPVPADQLPGTLRPLIAASATREVVIRCADEVSHGAFVSVLDEARGLGAANLAVVEGATR